MKVKLSDIAQIQFGVYSKPADQGNAAYLQAKHFADDGNRKGALDTFLQIDRKNESHLLQSGDILLAGKGYRNFAWTYFDTFGPAMASSIFFVMKPDQTRVLPDFLTTVFNLHQTQVHFQTLGAGSSIPSIRKSELEAFALELPSLARQRKAIEIKQIHYQDMELSRKILLEKQQVYQAVIQNIIYQKA